MSSREQLAIAEFAQALLVIPKTLAIKRGYHAQSQSGKGKDTMVAQARFGELETKEADGDEEMDLAQAKYAGLDLDKGKIANRVKAGVLEPAMSKIKSIKFATEAAITILRIDDSISLAKKENPRDPSGRH